MHKKLSILYGNIKKVLNICTDHKWFYYFRFPKKIVTLWETWGFIQYHYNHGGMVVMVGGLIRPTDVLKWFNFCVRSD
jgi:TRAP-type mannitol/chloroaromatic compound transport system permease small subunit